MASRRKNPLVIISVHGGNRLIYVSDPRISIYMVDWDVNDSIRGYPGVVEVDCEDGVKRLARVTKLDYDGPLVSKSIHTEPLIDQDVWKALKQSKVEW